jgi:hypothetical protein
MIAVHLDPELKERLTRALWRPERQPPDWTVPVRPNDLRRLMAAAGMCGCSPNAPFWDQQTSSHVWPDTVRL